MAEKKSRTRRPKQTYVERTNAVHVTLYTPNGGPLPQGVAEAAQQQLLELAQANSLLIGVATT